VIGLAASPQNKRYNLCIRVVRQGEFQAIFAIGADQLIDIHVGVMADEHLTLYAVNISV